MAPCRTDSGKCAAVQGELRFVIALLSEVVQHNGMAGNRGLIRGLAVLQRRSRGMPTDAEGQHCCTENAGIAGYRCSLYELCALSID